MLLLKRLLLGLVVLLLIVPLALYYGSLDWQRQHTKTVAALPIWTTEVSSGKYRLKVGNDQYLVRVAGLQQKGSNVILLHGFPESSIMWEAVIDSVARQGYRVLAFDQRGYSPHKRPTQVSEYDLKQLSSDVFAVADAVGFRRFHLVGHDWGAAVGWNATMNEPARIHTWTALSIPHLGTFFDGVVHDTLQAKRSGYFQLFQKPYLPEFLLTYAGQRNLKKMLASLPEKDRHEYLKIWGEPGALTAALNWYRAMNVAGFVKARTFEKPIDCPTCFIWGTKDGVIAPSIIEKQQRWMRGPFQVVTLDAGHALVQERPKETIKAILANFKVGEWNDPRPK